MLTGKQNIPDSPSLHRTDAKLRLPDTLNKRQRSQLSWSLSETLAADRRPRSPAEAGDPAGKGHRIKLLSYTTYS